MKKNKPVGLSRSSNRHFWEGQDEGDAWIEGWGPS